MTNTELIRQEIERRIEILTNVYAQQLERNDEEMATYYHGKIVALEELGSFIDSLPKGKEIDLDEEITKYWKDISSIYGAVGKEITRFDFDDVCRYFYELGKNARKEK